MTEKERKKRKRERKEDIFKMEKHKQREIENNIMFTLRL